MTDTPTGAQVLPFQPGARVLVVAGVGTGNVGDEAMLSGLLERLGRERAVTVVSADPEATAKLHGVEAVSPGTAVTALAKSDAVIIGGGSLFTSAMGTRGRLIPLFGLMATAARKPVALAGISIDATTPAANRPLVRRLARRAQEVRVRDRASAEMLASWSVEAVVEPDLSTWMPAPKGNDGSRALVEAGIQRGRPVVALCLTGVDPVLEVLLLDAIPQVVAAIPEVQFCFMPMSHHPTARHEDDVRLARLLRRATPGVPILPSGLHPAEVLGLFLAFDAAVCMRYHSLLFAHRAGIPVVGVPYAEKCRVWMAENGLRECPVDASVLVASILEALESGRAPAPEPAGAGKR